MKEKNLEKALEVTKKAIEMIEQRIDMCYDAFYKIAALPVIEHNKTFYIDAKKTSVIIDECVKKIEENIKEQEKILDEAK